MKFVLLLVFSIVLCIDIASAQVLRCSATTWTSWACSVTCGNGTFIRTRTCLNGTAPCSSCWETKNRTIENQTMNCVREPCPFCAWTDFTTLPCSTSCNTGVRLRIRQCLTVSDGQPCGTCDGSEVESEPCAEQPACFDSCGANSHFERNYTDCGITCQTRNTGAAACTIRSAGCVCNAGYFFDNVAGKCVKECDCGCFDSNDGYHAVNEVWNGTCSTYVCNSGGIITTIGTICNVSFIPTPVNGGWTAWTDPNPIVCPVTCGNGTRPQYRTCTNPTPQFGGTHCTGSGYQLVPCSTSITCPSFDTWSAWSPLSGCSVTCGNGLRTSYRNCTRATGTSGGDATCNGSSVNTTACNAGPCPVDGAWTVFSNYSTCSSICSPGLQASRRNCVNQTSGGVTCTGYGLQFRNCSGVNETYQCDAMGFWSNWTALSSCSVSCGVGFQYQTRQCLGAGFGCVGEAINTVVCNTSVACPVDGTWADWSAWSSCPATCGTATIFRTRNCTGAANGGVCLGSTLDTQLCDTNVSCLQFPYNATDGNYTAWSSWGACSSTCGSGSRIRTRSCTNPLPRFGGRYCSGSPIEIETCNTTQACPINGNWTDWQPWSTCSGTCGNGTQSRIRVCGNPSPSNGGQQCEGSSVQIQSCSTNMECPIDGVWGNWSLTVPCFGVCGNGTQIYTRNCTPPIAGGMICTGPTRREETCNLGRPCPVNGGWDNWSNFTTCSATCGVGVYSRIRECNNPTPQHGGDMCVGPPLETAYCLTNVTCPIHGGWTQWTGWSNCSLNCSGGIQTRTRNCSQPAPAFNGLPCLGSGYQYQTCNDDIPCVTLITGNPVNGTWGNWSDWSSCAGTCGNGTRTRFRTCSGQYNGGYPCVGPSLQAEACATNVLCPIDGGWSNFTSYGPCSATCGNGTQVRTRNCDNPIPQNGGAQCVGSSRDVTTCSSNRPCPIDGGWTEWAESACSSTCGIGYRVRQRNCSNPAPQFGGAPCIGLALDTILCNVSNVSCPIMGQWSSWVTVNNCSATCGTGYTIRNRTCLPAGVDNCVGDSIQIETCDSGLSCATPAPWNSVSGNWSEWSAWSSCSASCGNGTQYKSRVCNNTRASQGGSLCRGDALQIQTCATNVACPVNGNWTEWTSYSACSTTCGPGIRTQIRFCNNTNNFNELCIGPALRTEICNQNVTCPSAGMWSNWTSWSTCSGSCGTGLQIRTRSCNVTAGGSQCPGSPLEVQQCNTTIPCPIDGGWGNWTDWTNCSSGTCAAGSSYRFRSCDNPSPSNGGQLCPGDAMETRVCYGIASCPINGNWAPWGNWSACSSTCIGGRRVRYRNCSDPAPSNGGISCIGSSVEVDSTCANSTCGFNPAVPIGTWSNWNAWSPCAATCGPGIMRRVRTCNTSGLPCIGSNFEVASCNSSINCPVDGVWSVWSNYSECTASCGVGIQTRTRLCVNQSDGGQPCAGSATQSIACNTAIPCPIDGQWTTWSASSPCSASCGVGVRVRTRTCSEIVPSFGGISCPGSSILTETCQAAQNCSVDGQWSSWAPWSACTATCGKSATKYTTRTCSNPAPLYGGAGCVGVGINITNCTELADCPVCAMNQIYQTTAPSTCPSLCSNPTNTSWCQSSTLPTCLCKSPYAWNAARNICSLWCDCGCYDSNNQKRAIGSVWVEDNCRTYQCIANTSGANTQPQAVLISQNCTDCVYFGWSPWSRCSVTCGLGRQSRNRSCLSLSNPSQTCNTCQGNHTENQLCLEPACEVCELSPYIPNSTCSRSCGGGNQTLAQSCFNIAATDYSVPQACSNAAGCPSSTLQIGACNTDVCLVCTWSSWVNGRCSVTCGTGIYSRARYCRDQFGGACQDCAANSDINGTRSCFFPSCTTGRRRRSVFDWLTSWLE